MKKATKPLTEQIKTIMNTLDRGEVSTEETAQVLEKIVAGNKSLTSAKRDEAFSIF